MMDDAHIQAMAIVIQKSRTRAMTCEELTFIFRMGYRKTKRYLDGLDGVERVDSFYRVPARHMPAEWLVHQQVVDSIVAFDVPSSSATTSDVLKSSN